MNVPINLNVEIRGQGFPILCLHGHPGSSQAMRVFTDALSQNYRTIAPDLRGYGKSRVSQSFEMSDHLLDLETLLDRQGIEDCLLLGWSLGGILAMELALRNPQRYRALVLIGTAARPRGAHPAVGFGDFLCTAIAAGVNQLAPGWQWNIDTFGRRSLFRWLMHQQTPTPYWYLAQQGVTAYLQTSRVATRALNTALRQGYNRLADVQKLTLPSLMLAGQHDVHITAASSQETAQALPNCEYQCWANAAHFLPWEEPNAVVGAIVAWLANHTEIQNSIVGAGFPCP